MNVVLEMDSQIIAVSGNSNNLEGLLEQFSLSCDRAGLSLYRPTVRIRPFMGLIEYELSKFRFVECWVSPAPEYSISFWGEVDSRAICVTLAFFPEDEELDLFREIVKFFVPCAAVTPQ
jgi:hypothetical protein